MTYPPTLTDTTFGDTTPQATKHARAHAELAAAFADVLAKLGSNPSGPHIDVTAAIVSARSRLDNLEAALTPTPPAGLPATYLAAYLGGSLESPEQTWSAVRTATESPAATLVYLSARLSADNVPVLVSTSTLDSVSSTVGVPVIYSTAAQLLSVASNPAVWWKADGYPAGSFLTLLQALRHIGTRKRVVVEVHPETIKGALEVTTVLDLITALGLKLSVYVAVADVSYVSTITAAGCKPVFLAASGSGQPHSAAVTAGARIGSVPGDATDAQITAAVAAGYPEGVMVRGALCDTRYGWDKFVTGLGARGVLTRAPAYMARTLSAALNSASWKSGGWPAGTVPYGHASGPFLRTGTGAVEITDKTSNRPGLVLGAYAGTSGLPAQVECTAEVMVSAPITAGAKGFYVHLGADDRPLRDDDVQEHNGYTFRWQADGLLTAWKHAAGGAITQIGEQATALVLTPKLWQSLQFKVTATAVTIGWGSYQLTVNDASFRVPWFLQVYSRAHTGGTWQIRNLARVL